MRRWRGRRRRLGPYQPAGKATGGSSSGLSCGVRGAAYRQPRPPKPMGGRGPGGGPGRGPGGGGPQPPRGPGGGPGPQPGGGGPGPQPGGGGPGPQPGGGTTPHHTGGGTKGTQAQAASDQRMPGGHCACAVWVGTTRNDRQTTTTNSSNRLIVFMARPLFQEDKESPLKNKNGLARRTYVKI